MSEAFLSLVRDGITFASAHKNEPYQWLRQRFLARWHSESPFRFVVTGTTLYVIARLTFPNVFAFKPVRHWVEKKLGKSKLFFCRSIILWFGEVEPEIPFGRLGYTRCLEADQDVLEKFNVPMNAEKCLRDGIKFKPGEFYEQFDLNEFDPKDTPLAWSYGPIMDPGLIMPTGWYNDMSGENQEFELFYRYMRIFGYLPHEAYSELYQHCYIMLLQTGQHLIRVGDSDDKIYIVIHGAIDIYSNRMGPLGEFVRLRTTRQGGHISSLFSIIDAIAGYSRPVQSIFATSKLNTTKVLTIPVAAIKDYFMHNPEYVVPAIKKLMERAYRFQYQILHIAMQLTSEMSSLDAVPIEDPPTNVVIPQMGEEIPDTLKEDAIRSFMNFLDIDDYSYLSEHCQVMVVEPEEETTDKDRLRRSVLNQDCSAYKYVYVGKLEELHLKSNLTPMEQQSRRKPQEEQLVSEPLIRIIPGQGVGGLTGILRYSDVLFFRCLERSVIVTLDIESLQELLENKPFAILPIVYMTVCRMSALVRAMDFAMEWTLAREGQYIYHKEQMCHNSYLILNGRARAYQLDTETEHRSILEYKENDWIGLADSLLQSKRRSKTCVVIRDTEFVIIPNDLLRHIVINYSSAAQVMLNFLVQRSIKSQKCEMPNVLVGAEAEDGHEVRHIHTIALLPAHKNLPYSVLAVEIKRHYVNTGRSCSILTYEKTLQMIHKQELTVKDGFALEMYILRQMQENDLVIFVCLPEHHYWNKVCSNQAEVMFTVGSSMIPNVSTEPPEYEEKLVGRKISTRRKELILLHRMDVSLPTNTKEWLYCRDWLHFHHHIRLPDLAFELLGDISEEELENVYGDCLDGPICSSTDLSRFNRWITTRTFGALFSSGGARIASQLGMLHALIEFGHIPIDMVCGTGAGFLIAALYAIYQDYAKVQEMITRIFKDFNDLSNLRWDDVTFPYINLGNGKRILVYLYELFGSIQLEDCWIPICCVTTNVTTQYVRIDRSGPIWVFARASLSHACYSPPICDPIDQDYICDGAHANSLPQDVLKDFGAEYIIAFNTVGGKFTDEMKADPNVSVIRFVKKTFSSFLKQMGLANPTIYSIFHQLATTQTRMYASGVEAVSSLKMAVFVRPPVEHLPSQEWRNLPFLHRVGYFYMKAILDRNPYREDIPFHKYWKNIRNTSFDMASEGGRDLNSFQTNVN